MKNNKVRQRVKAIQERFRSMNLSWASFEPQKTIETLNEETLKEKMEEMFSVPHRELKAQQCTHPDVPLRKSNYSDEMLQLGYCQRCNTNMIELD